jgi:predicted P-loop ATPase
MLQANLDAATKFLEWLRSPPWTLTAIIPDGTTLTRTFTTIEAARTFAAAHNADRNIYYSLNPTRATDKKSKKSDITAIEFIHADLDPKDDESPEAAKSRYLEALKAFKPQPSAIIDSGNGIQALWRLKTPQPPDQLTAVEARSKAVMETLGSEAGTQNIDRILRVPGTINHPNEKKQKGGRVPCVAEIVEFNGVSYGLGDFPAVIEDTDPTDSGHADDDDELERTILDGGQKRHGGTRSEQVWWVINEMLRRGYLAATIIPILLDRNNRISDHIYNQANPRPYAERQIKEACKKLELAIDQHGRPYRSQTNICIALMKLKVEMRYDQFADHISIKGLPDFGPVLNDAAMTRLRLTMDRRFKLSVHKEMFFEVVCDAARLNGFHPVRDYLDQLTWDGVPRIDRWLVDYAKVEATQYACTVSALMLIASVRRVRRPGVKFDELIVLENKQGTNRSTALRILAVRDEWFTDDFNMKLKGKEVIEQLRGKWIIEIAEMTGHRGELEHIKALLSRQFDRGRLVWDRLTSEIGRQNTFWGTTNDAAYLRDLTGNRRFWPIKCEEFDLDGLTRDVDQLWAEAAAREAKAKSIHLDRELWSAAAEEQDKRLIHDPFEDLLIDALGHIKRGKISAAAIWDILDVKGGQRTQELNRRMGDAMRQLGWDRPNKAKLVRIKGRLVSGYVIGEAPWPMVVWGKDGYTTGQLDKEDMPQQDFPSLAQAVGGSN